jgi:hypothetical protein
VHYCIFVFLEVYICIYLLYFLLHFVLKIIWINYLPQFLCCIMIQVDIGGHPHVPNYNWPIWTIFSSTCFSIMGKCLCNYGFFTYRDVLNPYTTSRWISMVTHLFQLDYFGSFHVSTSLCTSRAILGI